MRSIGWLALGIAAGLAVGCPANPSDDDDGADDDDATGDACAAYPAADNDFAVGSVVRNYHFWDQDDAEFDLCELAGAARGNTLLFLSISATTCGVCASEVPQMRQLATEYGPQGVVVLQSFDDATSAALLGTGAWSEVTEYRLVRTDPPTQPATDYGPTFEGFPTLPLIDLRTMQVLEADCWYAASYTDCIEAHL